MLDPKALGRRLAAARRQGGFSLEQIAGYLGQAKEPVLAIEAGQESIDLPTLHRLEDLYGVSVSEFLDPESPVMVVDVTRDAARLSATDLVVFGQLRRFTRNLDDLNRLVSAP